MRNIVSVLLLLIVSCPCLLAQNFRATDQSPMDMAYFPDGYAHDIRFAPDELAFDHPIIRVVYSRPALKGRKLPGKLLPYGEVWRVGANEAPEIRFFEDVQLGGKMVKAGDYALLAVPDAEQWTIILSRDMDQWGAYSYDMSQDIVRVSAEVSRADEMIENFSIQFQDKGKGVREGTMLMGWGHILVRLPFSF